MHFSMFFLIWHSLEEMRYDMTLRDRLFFPALVLALCTVLAVGASAQSFRSASNRVEVPFAPDTYINAITKVTNLTANTIQARVEVTDKTKLPADWNTQICFFGNCFPPGVMKVDGSVAPNEEQEIDLTFVTASVPKSGEVQVTISNQSNSSDKIMITFICTALTGVESPAPAELALQQNYPNPFSLSQDSRTSIAFSTTRSGQTQLKVYNLLGREVRTLYSSSSGAGRHVLIWDGRDATGSMLPPGVYIYKLSADGRSMTKRLMLTR